MVAGLFARDRQGPIAGEPVRPVDEPCLKGLLDQQRLEAGAVEIEVAVNDAAVLEVEGFDSAAFGVAFDFDDAAFDAGDAALFGVATQEMSVQARIEVVGVGKLGHVWRHARHGWQKALLGCGDRRGRVVAQRVGVALGGEA